MKRLKTNLRLGFIIFFILALYGCDVDLSVKNHNAPDRDRVFHNPCDVEKYLGSSFREYWRITEYFGPALITSCLADELTTSWCAMHYLDTEPRPAWDNSPLFAYSFVTERSWAHLYRAIHQARDVLDQIAKGMKFIDDGGTENTVRNKAFGKFIQGISFGFLGLTFDKAVILDENTDLEPDDLKPVPFDQVIHAAIEKLDECINFCNTYNFEIPEEWWPGNYFNQDDLCRLAHSYAARILACKARSPEERAAADWITIKNHAEVGITSDFSVYCDAYYWWSYLHGLGSDEEWFRADYKLIGPADTSGNYATWLATPIHDRNHIYIHTDDRRVTGGDSTSDGTYFAYYGECPFREDRGTYRFSYYHCKRFLDYYQSGYVGYAPIFTVAENNLLHAEAELRLGNTQAAADLINLTRVPNGGLPPADDSNVGDFSDHRYVHGSLWAMLKYEKGIETCQANVGVAWFDRRGWGELPSRSILHFPIPGAELELMGMTNYTFGGGGPGSTP